MRIAVLLLLVSACAKREAAKTFTCGEQRCDARTSYCEMIKTDVPALPSTFTCKPLPTACTGAGASCNCFPTGTRCDYCTALEHDGVRHFQRTCVGGR